MSIGVEEELMVLDAETLLLAPRAAELIAACKPISSLRLATAQG